MIARGRFKIVLVSKIALKKVFKIIFNSSLLGYVGFTLFSLSACSKTGDETFFDELLKARNKTTETLLQKFDAQMFPCNLEGIFNKPIILDSVVIGIKQIKNEFFIRAKVNTGCDKKCFAELKCSDEIIKQYNRTKSNYAFIAAKVTKVINYNLTADADSLEGGKPQLSLGDAVLLSGECLALAEISPIINAH